MATVVTSAGRDIVTNRILGAGTVPQHIGWGTGAGVAAVGDTDLFTPATEARVAGAGSRVTTTTANDTHQVVGTLTANGTKTITNAGVFDAAGAGSPPAGGNLYVKGDFAGLPLVAGDQIQFTIKVQFS